MKKNKKVLYSCIAGRYDNIPIHKYVAPDWDYVLFTDNKKLIKQGHYKHWTIKPLVFDKLTNVKNVRWHKINTHILFPDYNYSLWIDSNIIINDNDVFKTMNQLIKDDVLVGVPNHPMRKYVYQEADTIKRIGIDYQQTINKEMRFLRHEKYPKKTRLSETNILFRKHNEIKNMLNVWWHMIEEYSKRDQLSFNYALWKNNIKNIPIYTDEKGFGIHHESPHFTFVISEKHNHDKITYKTKWIPRFLGRIICLCIPFANLRRNFRQRFVKD